MNEHPKCSTASCTYPVSAKGLCLRCYKLAWSRARRSARPPRPTVEARFWSYVNKDGPRSDSADSACWDWIGAIRMPDGYGVLNVDRKARRAHRLSWAFAGNEDPGDKFLLHLCDRPCCVNPAHLRIGTHADNMHDMSVRKRSKFHKAVFEGSTHGMAKLTEATVVEIRAQRAAGGSLKGIAAAFGVSPSTIHLVGHRKIWDHVP